jgi:hypothetical protein
VPKPTDEGPSTRPHLVGRDRGKEGPVRPMERKQLRGGRSSVDPATDVGAERWPPTSVGPGPRDLAADRPPRSVSLTRNQVRRRRVAPEGPGARGSAAMGPAEASEDALDTDRRVQQYGLLAQDGRGARGGALRGGWGWGPSEVAVSSWGSLCAAEARLRGLTTSAGTLPRALQSGQTGVQQSETAGSTPAVGSGV